jgi:hypothetical protein
MLPRTAHEQRPGAIAFVLVGTREDGVGFFGAYLYADGSWTEVDPDGAESATPVTPWLFLSIHDSDVATVRYAPSGSGTGEAFLGNTPRNYWENPDASAPTNPALEADGLASWTRVAQTGAAPAAETIEAFLASDEDEGPDDDADAPDEDVFVELKCVRFLGALGLPLPRDLA